MKGLIKIAKVLLRDSDVKEVKLVKDGDSKVEVYENGKYAGRWKVDYSEKNEEMTKEDFIEGLHKYWDSVHGEGHSNPRMIKWIEENL